VAEAREGLRELEPDGAAAEHEHRLGQLLEVECSHVVDPVLGETGDRRHLGARPGRDQDAVADELAPVDAHVLGPDGYVRLLDLAAAENIAGGALYDALVAATAREAGAKLLTLDRRAVTTYRLLRVDYQLVA
jgi:predicted nucleic acid-binding protein